jgi:hypothetical protein
MEELARILVSLSIVHAQRIILELGVNMSMMLVPQELVRMELSVLTMEAATSAYVHLVILAKIAIQM